MLTWYSLISPFSRPTRCSLIQALLTFRSVFVGRATPCLMASSKLWVDVELISVTRAIAMGRLLVELGLGVASMLRLAPSTEPCRPGLSRCQQGVIRIATRAWPSRRCVLPALVVDH